MVNCNGFCVSGCLEAVSDDEPMELLNLFALESLTDVFEDVDDEDFVRCFVFDPSAKNQKRN
jgi:hypothetical protein